MPARVTYWTGTWDPAREAISKEIEALRGAGRPPVVSFSPGQRSGLAPRSRVIKLSARRWITLRVLASFVEPHGDVTHVFGGCGSWDLLRSLGRRPILLTVAIPAQGADRQLLEKVRLFAAETEPLARALRHHGVPPERIELVYPGVDLTRFGRTPIPSTTPFRLVFASTPADAREFEWRGIPLLVELARRSPGVEVLLMWRSWGSQSAARRALEGLRLPPNVKVVTESMDIAAAYASAHAVVCFFADGFGKSCPNSVIEALACGRPALVARSCGIGDLIEARGAGIAVERSVESALAGLHRLQGHVHELADGARALAEECFDVRKMIGAYAGLYQRLVAGQLAQGH